MSTATAAPPIEIHDITVAYHTKPVLWNVDLDIPAGCLVGIVGPNGAGKSTLLKAILGLVPLSSGWVKLFGETGARPRKRIAYVPQRESVDWDFPARVIDVALMGRYGRLGWFRRPRREDRRIAHEALAKLGIADLADRQINRLSGGQQQRTFLSRALAQDADVYLMDEPFAGVDAPTEKAILALLRELRDAGRTVVCVHHDLQTVPEYFDRAVLLNLRLVAEGPVDEAFTPANLQNAFGGRQPILEHAATRLLQRREGEPESP